MYQKRYRHILWFFAKIILSFIWWELILSRIGFRKLVSLSREKRFRAYAIKFRQEAIKMGGVMIKVGQFLSARLDVLPTFITDELAGLQDEVLPEKFEDLLKVAQAEFDIPFNEKFEYVDPIPLAAASIGQVHLARLQKSSCSDENDFCEVIVKIQRPNIEEIVNTDLSALAIVARWLMFYPPVRKRANIPDLLNELRQSTLEELDYLREGKNAEQFSENFATDPIILVPKVVWSHTSRHVLTLEYINAIKIIDYQTLDKAEINRAAVADKLFDTYLQQIFEDRFFHADPHPGNLFVLPLDEQEAAKIGQNWRLVFIDFGMTGSISEKLMYSLREILIAVGTQDAKRIIDAYKTLGVLLPSADVDLLERATNKVFERFWGKTAPELRDMHQSEAVAFVQEFGSLIYEMPFQIPQNIMLLARSLGILSGICTGLYEPFNVWENITPYVQKLVTAEENGGWQFWLKEIGNIVTLIAGLPRKTDTLLNRIEQGKLIVRVPETDRNITALNLSIKKLTAAVLLTGFLLIATQLYNNQELVIAAVFTGGAMIALGYILFAR
jgi:predicted unusual protein kinase regulating ubiquinone biosynthesis (AarF/ABC1/UbiB family)